jgi:cytochrome P450
MTTVDLTSEAFQANPYPSYALLREQGPVHRVTGAMGLESWLITRYEEARTALNDPRLSKDARLSPEWLHALGAGSADEGPLGQNMLNSDPPDHTRLRRLVSRGFTRHRVEALRPRVQKVTDGYLDEMMGRSEVDLMAALAFPLPITVICELLGIPADDRDEFGSWTRMALSPPLTEEAVRNRRLGNDNMDRYVLDLIARMRSEVDLTLGDDAQPDLVSAMVAASDDQDRLSERELLGSIKLMLVAGHKTTVNLIGNGMLALLRHPDQLRLLRERPDLLPSAIEELLRYDGSVERATMRFATEDVEIGGVTIPAGGAVSVVLAAADRSPDQFADPDRLDITRRNNPHVAFGHGIHFCLGAPLARMEGQVAFGSLLGRFPDIRLGCAPEELRWAVGGPNIIRGLAALPVKL